MFGVQVHTEGKPAFRCSWNPVDADYVLSTSSDGFAAVLCVSRQAVERTYRHPAPVFGCDWHKADGRLFATGCQDSVVRVFDRTQDGCLHQLRGHGAKVFNVAWSTLLPHMLMSGSDDTNVHVWDTSAPDPSASPTVLRGHTQNVRALIWHSEIPWMVVTGSWDATIRVWDFRSGECVRVVADHHADVYGLGSHPERPFLFVSSSRDNTIRQWRLDDVIATMPVASLITGGGPGAEFGGLLSDVQGAMGQVPTVLAGEASRQLAARLEGCADDCDRAKLVSCFLSSPPDVAELWNLAHTILSGKTVSVRNRIVHADDVLRSVQARAQELEGARVAKFTGVGGARKEEQLEAAASLYLRLGLLQQHCEILVELGLWERALSVAPGASMGYWRDLSLRYAAHLDEQKKFEEAVPYLAATHSVDQLVESVVSHGKLEDAFVVAKAACEGRFPPLDAAAAVPVDADLAKGGGAEAEGRLRSVSRLLAQRHATLGRPVLAAACRLAVNDAPMAVRALYMGNELATAAALASTFGQQDETSDAVYGALALSLESEGSYELATEVLRKQRPDAARLSIELLAARYTGSSGGGGGGGPEEQAAPDVERFYERAGLEPPSAFAARASGARSTAEELGCYAAARQWERAAKIGVGELRRLLSGGGWALDEAEALSRPLQSIDAASLTDELKGCVLFYTAFVGSALACASGMVSVAGSLARHARRIATQHRLFDGGKLPEGLSDPDLEALATAYEAGHRVLELYRAHALAPSHAANQATGGALAELGRHVEALPRGHAQPAIEMLGAIETEVTADQPTAPRSFGCFCLSVMWWLVQVRAGPTGSSTSASTYCWGEVVPLAAAIPSGRPANECATPTAPLPCLWSWR